VSVRLDHLEGGDGLDVVLLEQLAKGKGIKESELEENRGIDSRNVTTSVGQVQPVPHLLGVVDSELLLGTVPRHEHHLERLPGLSDCLVELLKKCDLSTQEHQQKSGTCLQQGSESLTRRAPRGGEVQSNDLVLQMRHRLVQSSIRERHLSRLEKLGHLLCSCLLELFLGCSCLLE
jgi:hypothetical protein